MKVMPCGRNETHLPHQMTPEAHCPGIMPIFHCGVEVPHWAHDCETYVCRGDSDITFSPFYPRGLVWNEAGDR